MVALYKRAGKYYVSINGAENEVSKDRYKELQAQPKAWWGVTDDTDNKLDY